MIETDTLVPPFCGRDWEQLAVMCVAPGDLVTRYAELFGETYNGLPIETVVLDGEPATIQPVPTYDADELSILLSVTIGERPEQFRYSMYVTPEALRRSMDRMSIGRDEPVGFFDAVDHYGPALNRIRWALEGIPPSESEIETRSKGRFKGFVTRSLQTALRRK